MKDSLFDMDAVAQDSPRMKLIKAEDIQTHCWAYCCEDSELWMAIPMKLACELLEVHCSSLDELYTDYCGLLDEMGLIAYGSDEAEAQNMALEIAKEKRKEGA